MKNFYVFLFFFAALNTHAADIEIEELDSIPISLVQDMTVQARLVELLSPKDIFTEYRTLSIDKITQSGSSFYVLSATDYPMPITDPVTYHFTIKPHPRLNGFELVSETIAGEWEN
jgi:hypothetical protein